MPSRCSLREAPGLAAAIRDVLARRLPVGETAEAVWDALWPAEKRRQVLLSIAAAHTRLCMHSMSFRFSMTSQCLLHLRCLYGNLRGHVNQERVAVSAALGFMIYPKPS